MNKAYFNFTQALNILQVTNNESMGNVIAPLCAFII